MLCQTRAARRRAGGLGRCGSLVRESGGGSTWWREFSGSAVSTPGRAGASWAARIHRRSAFPLDPSGRGRRLKSGRSKLVEIRWRRRRKQNATFFLHFFFWNLYILLSAAPKKNVYNNRIVFVLWTNPQHDKEGRFVGGFRQTLRGTQKVICVSRPRGDTSIIGERSPPRPWSSPSPRGHKRQFKAIWQRLNGSS